MLEYISLIFLVFTSLIGIYSIANCITNIFFSSIYTKSVVKFLPLKGDVENVDIVVVNLLDDYGNLIIIDYGINEKTKNKIIENTHTYKKLKLISPAEIEKHIKLIDKDFI